MVIRRMGFNLVYFICLKRVRVRGQRGAQCLRLCTVLAEDQSLVPSHQLEQLTIAINSGSGAPESCVNIHVPTRERHTETQ